jgi:hypothetical protein
MTWHEAKRTGQRVQCQAATAATDSGAHQRQHAQIDVGGLLCFFNFESEKLFEPVFRELAVCQMAVSI